MFILGTVRARCITSYVTRPTGISTKCAVIKDIELLHALLTLGIYLLPWRCSAMLLILLTLAAGIGIAAIVTAMLGWLLFLRLCWYYA